MYSCSEEERSTAWGSEEFGGEGVESVAGAGGVEGGVEGGSWGLYHFTSYGTNGCVWSAYIFFLLLVSKKKSGVWPTKLPIFEMN